MADRRGHGSILTPAEAEVQWAIPCFYLLAGKAQAAFPQSFSGSQSGIIKVIRTSPEIVETHRGAFPAYLGWRQWKEAVAPVLEDDRWRLQIPLWGGGLGTERIETLIQMIGKALKISFETAGYGQRDVGT